MPLDRPLDPVPRWLEEEVLEPVLADLQQPRPVDLIVGMEPADSDFPSTAFWGENTEPMIWIYERGHSGIGFELPDRDEPRASLLVRWGDVLQEQFFPETVAAWGEARPACPGHPHPASAVLLDGEAWWLCPSTQEPISRIGHIP